MEGWTERERDCGIGGRGNSLRPVGELHHEVESGDEHQEVEEGVRVGHTVLLIVVVTHVPATLILIVIIPVIVLLVLICADKITTHH